MTPVERGLDRLARALAEPMPRRRALRLLGTSVVAAVLPGITGPRALAAPSRSAACGNDERVCREFTAEQYCCPAPSWRYWCGAQPGTCEDRCTGENAFPCTGLKPDKYSGVNGVCCDSRYHVACDQDAKPRLSGGGSRPLCVPKTCGPDVTDALVDVLSRVEARFADWGSAKRFSACANLVTLPGAAISWDINQLGPGGRERLTRRYRPKCATCGFSVQVGGVCHYTGSVNYALFGVMMRLCHGHFQGSTFESWFSREAMLELIYTYKHDSGNYQASNEWALAGFRSSSVSPTPVADRPACGACTTPFRERLTFKWLPLVVAG